MQTISELKEQLIAQTPLLLFTCELPNGQVERWSTHRVAVDGLTYEARVLRHTLFELQTASDQGVDAIPRVSIVLANADSHFSEIERLIGWKGAKVTVRFLFFDLRRGEAASESRVLFRGIANPPDEITEAEFRLSAINRMNMQRVMLPEVRIQRRCPWQFPATQAQREEGIHGGQRGRYSRFFRCGYSADIEGGCGNLSGSTPFASCSYTRADCEARGMFSIDARGNPTRRFGGLEFVPSSISVRTYGEKGSHLSAVSENTARYNDFVPLVYGTAWYTPPIVFARNDGNLTHMEVLLGMGGIDGIVKVLVNDVEIPVAINGRNMTSTGWYALVTSGNPIGGFNLDFRDGAGRPAGDPYGSMAYVSVVVPNRINDGQRLPRVKVLLKGLRLPTYDSEGGYITDEFTNNPVWVLLDILQRSGWLPEEIDYATFANAATFCREEIVTQDPFGNPITVPRFQCNLVLEQRRNAADVIRGIRNGCRLLLTYGASGLLELHVENSIALAQTKKPDGSNAADPLSGGWPSYEFGDGTNGLSAILRKASGEPTIRLWSRSTADTPNRFSVEFQDAFNEYQQDSLSLIDVADVDRTGQEITAPLPVLGIPNFDQAARILKFHLDRAIQGNTYVEFDTSVKGFGIRPGDIITLTYLKEGFDRQPFRVLKIAPGTNFLSARITAQLHQDSWYEDTNGQVPGAGGRRQPGAGTGVPRPLVGTVINDDGEIELDVTESYSERADGTYMVETSIEFLAPNVVRANGPGIPLVSLAPVIGTEGTIEAGQVLYYAISAVDADGHESALSFIVHAAIPDGANNYCVTLTGVSLGPDAVAFHVYRGTSPAQMYRIASDQTPANSFQDSGLARELVAPPDQNYDHANFYWRLELQPAINATIHTPDAVGCDALQMNDNEYRGAVARITRGKGAGQERTIVSNTSTTVTLATEWTVEPDATSQFVISEAAWHFGASGRTSPVKFEIPNRTGAVVQILGRAANVNDLETAAELSPMARWTVGGAGSTDADAPPKPVFGLGLGSTGGVVEISGVAFADLANTHGVVAGTLTLHYWNELNGPSPYALDTDTSVSDDIIVLSTSADGSEGDLVQMEGEVARIDEVLEGGKQYRVTRGMHGSEAGSHASGTPVYHLTSSTSIFPFIQGFFGSPYSGTWNHQIPLADARIASAELFVTNRKGNSESAAVCFTQTVDYGLRTLSGGQFSIQVEGFLAVDSNAAPDLVIEAAHSVRDIFAVVKQAPIGGPLEVQISQDGALYCILTIPSEATISSSINGGSLPPLAAGARVSMAITAVGLSNPGADLTVVIRL